MFTVKGRDQIFDPKEPGKAPPKPTVGDASGLLSRPTALNALRPSPLPPLPGREVVGAHSHTPVPREEPPPAPAPATGAAVQSGEPAGSKLFVGTNIKLKGVEISDCDVLVIEGQVEATILSHTMQISKPGTLKGNATIDVAEIQGEFSGELTARKRLVVHGSGRVCGTIRYGQLIVSEGGEVSGDVKRIEGAEKEAAPRAATAAEARASTAHSRGGV